MASDGYQGVSLQRHVATSVERWLVGFAIGASLGTVLGLASGYYRVMSAVVSPIVALFRPIPPIAYLPLAVLILGIGELPKVTMIAAAAFFYMYLTTAAGVAGVPRSMVQAGRMLGLSNRQLFGSVIFRAALPEILVGANIALVLSWAVVVAAELVSASAGLGHVALDAATYARVDVVYAAVLLIGVIGALAEVSVRLIQRWALPWVGK